MLLYGHRVHNPPLSLLAVVLALAAAPALAQGAHGAGPSPQPAAEAPRQAEKAARRFPQPVRVGDLVDRQVLEPSSRQRVLGRVDGVARAGNGTLLLLLRYGGALGYGTRTIAVPVEATTLLGQFVQVVDVEEARLNAMPAFDGAGTTRLGADEVIRIGLNRN